jgi:hypothetical protein
MASDTVRIRASTHDKLKELAERSGRSMPEVLDEAVEAYRRQQFLEEVNRAFAALRSDPEAWREEQEERSAWEATIADDLEGD